MDDWKYVDPRWKNVPGCILDIGCAGWGWSRQFRGTGRDVVGFDPFEESQPTWVRDLRRQAVGAVGGSCWLWKNKKNPVSSGMLIRTSVLSEHHQVPMVSFSEVLDSYRHSVVKLNVEGSEYAILTSVQHPVSDQLVVSFHGWSEPRWEGLETHLISWLSRWYEPIQIHEKWQWWLFLSR